MSKSKVLIYGANGYTGELIAEEAKKNGLADIVLAGRNSEAVNKIADRLGLESRIFNLDDSPANIAAKLLDVKYVLHCAGPFIKTAVPMAKACIKAKAHYFDITGEIPVYESMAALSSEAEAAGVMLMPGVGFDIVPTDCLSKAIAEKMPDAVDLKLAFAGFASVSAGTTKSALAQMPEGSKIREAGEMKTIPMFSKGIKRSFPFKGGENLELYAIPWGDVFTAYYSTGIKNIAVYTQLPGIPPGVARLFMPVMGVLKNKTILGFAQDIAGALISGPDEKERATAKVYLWGQGTDAAGNTVEIELTTIEAYRLTVLTALAAVAKTQAGQVKPGFQTPSLVFGKDFIAEFDGCEYKYL